MESVRGARRAQGSKVLRRGVSCGLVCLRSVRRFRCRAQSAPARLRRSVQRFSSPRSVRKTRGRALSSSSSAKFVFTETYNSDDLHDLSHQSRGEFSSSFCPARLHRSHQGAATNPRTLRNPITTTRPAVAGPSRFQSIVKQCQWLVVCFRCCHQCNRSDLV